MEKLKKPEGDNNTDGDPNIGSLEKERAHTCDMDMDEDDYMRLMSDERFQCPYYRLGDEYAVVRKQN